MAAARCVLDNDNREEVIAGSRRDRDMIGGFARWLAERADVPLREPGVTE